MLRLTVNHSGPAAGLNVMHWQGDLDTPGLAQDAADAVSQFLEEISGAISGQQTMRVDPEVVQINAATGALENVASVSTSPVVGAGGTNLAGQALSILFRWNTGTVVNGRFLKGRTYIPGMSPGTIAANGELAPATADILLAATVGLIGPGAFSVWSPTGGVAYDVSSASIWSELAVQRRRRS